jgi:hypothetical protein
MSAAPDGIRRLDSNDMLMEQVEQALRMTPEERFRAGGELFDAGCRFAMAGIRGTFHGASDEECFKRLKQRIAWVEELEPATRP